MAELRVIATAGHVDHGKSSLITRLTGRDPDRWAEEKRRGLTIDLGFAWCTLPSGREVGFVDVPGHERFIGNMLAGVGAAPAVLFVVAVDEGWARQSEEHLQILDVLGVAGGVVALTKVDLVEPDDVGVAREAVERRLTGTALDGAPIVPVSSTTGYGFDALITALDAMLAAVPVPDRARPRLFVDRVFSITGAGTVVTGTLTGGSLAVGMEAELYPTGRRARIRSLQTHERDEASAEPVSRVAVNLAGLERGEIARGAVLGRPAEWRPTRRFEARLRTVREIDHPITQRGAFLLYAGTEETEAKLHLYGATRLERGEETFARISVAHPLVLDVGDRFVIRDAGRRETVGGGVVLDVAPPARAGADPASRLRARAAAERPDLVALLVRERKAISVEEAALLTGTRGDPADAIGGWLVAGDARAAIERDVVQTLLVHHRDHPLSDGLDVATIRTRIADTLRGIRAPSGSGLIDACLDDLVDRGLVAREGSTVRSPTHRVDLTERSEDLERLLSEIGGPNEATPPDVPALVASGIDREVIEAAARAGDVVRLSPELVVTPALIERAEHAIRDAGEAGITVSRIREALGTTRKYAVPLLEWLDRQGITRREGDLRFLRSS